MVTSPSHPNANSHYRTGSLGTAVSVKNERPRRDTTTSSDLSSDNEMESSALKGQQIRFSSRNRIIEPPEEHRMSNRDTMTGEDLNEEAENSGAESVGSGLSSDFDATTGSASLLEDVDITGSLGSSSPIALMQ